MKSKWRKESFSEYRCPSCKYKWLYFSVRCPVCSHVHVLETVKNIRKRGVNTE
jgi:hypothetical protein